MIATSFWFFIKFALLGGFLVFACLGLSSMVLYYLGIPISRISHRVEFFYTILLYFIFIYINGFLGAYYFELVNHYNIDHHIKQRWILIIISLFCLSIWLKETTKELNRQVKEISDKMDPMYELKMRIYTGVFNKELLYHVVINCTLKTAISSILGFIIFLIFPSLSSLLYSTIPESISKWFN
jgi:hypothetical protein